MILVRPASRGDIAAVSALLARTWHDTYDAILGADSVAAITREWHAPDRLADEIGRPGHAFFVAETAGALAGTASVTDRGDGIVSIDRLYVAPEAQGQGIGRALFSAAVRAFPKASVIRLEVEEKNARACRFYEKRGLSAIGHPADCGGCGNAIVYEGRGVAALRGGLVLRPVRDGDAQDLFGLLSLCFAEYPGCFVDPHGDLPDLVHPARSFADKGGAYWVVEDPAGRVGACVGVDFPAAGTAELHRLYVRPDLRGSGLGRRLVDHVEAHAAALGAQRMMLWSDTRFTTAHRLYERLGYRRAGEIRALGDISNSSEFFFEKPLV
ncbi:N-acetylglutamate synthase or related acetyltransferase, GNAT family [Chelatococcus sambhunathii]|uniref:N-acetylglutamate synthase or related acetyltransferase, GNAT family n=1 Tax=Chelatococcus sambhunathii TaxID=363953 RepID=A0ABM9U289_9HYPH|nr:GNAT family N-acetyltransferase [Chelatococcus sambhunathii]CUA85682.1 N-acetylglutamate synthase or related acetyltransferase, GNAT family [Chelatococcus sambhunathii]